MRKITKWIKKSLANPDFSWYAFCFILYFFMLFLVISIYSSSSAYLSDGVEKDGIIIHVGDFNKGRTYIAKVKKDNTEVRFHTYYELSIGDKASLLVMPNKPSLGTLGRKSSSLFDLIVHRNGSMGRAVFYLILMSFGIASGPITAIVLYRNRKSHGRIKRVHYTYNAINQVTNKKRYSNAAVTNLVAETNWAQPNLTSSTLNP